VLLSPAQGAALANVESAAQQPAACTDNGEQWQLNQPLRQEGRQAGQMAASEDSQTDRRTMVLVKEGFQRLAPDPVMCSAAMACGGRVPMRTQAPGDPPAHWSAL
jgi:hypothetical protein